MENNTLAMAIAAYRSNTSEENLGYLYRQLLNSTLAIPVIIEQKQFASDAEILKNETHINLYVMKSNTGKRYYLAFSSKENLNAFHNGEMENSIPLNLHDLCRLLHKDERIAGILLDPESGNMVFERELLFTLEEIESEPQQLN